MGRRTRRLARAAHAARNPMSAVAGLTDLLVGAESDPERRRTLELIAAAAQRALRQFTNILRSDEDSGAETLVVDLLAELAELHATRLAASQIALLLEPPSERLAVGTCADELSEVLENLLMNACQAIQSEGAPGLIRLAAGREGGRLVIEVADSGPGIPVELRGVVLSRGFSTKPDGGGIGLWTAADVARRLGGHVEIEDALEGGALVRLRLPLQGAPTPPALSMRRSCEPSAPLRSTSGAGPVHHGGRNRRARAVSDPAPPPSAR